jgi:hypothetical protein
MNWKHLWEKHFFKNNKFAKKKKKKGIAATHTHIISRNLTRCLTIPDFWTQQQQQQQ